MNKTNSGKGLPFPLKKWKENLTMKRSFGTIPSGETATLYTISNGHITASVTDYGATLVSLLVPDSRGNVADVVLGCDDAAGYAKGTCFLGCVVGRNANRIGNAAFPLNGKTVRIPANEGNNNLHSGPDCFHLRLWTLKEHTENAVTFRLDSPNGDQGYPGNATIHVTYALEQDNSLLIAYDGICDQDTVFNLTNHSYFNLSGQENTGSAMAQELTLPARHFTVANAESIPTGELRNVEGTPMDFRTPKAIGRDIEADYEPLHLQGGYDHNFEVFCNPCAILHDPASGRTMRVSTDCCGVQFYAGNFLKDYGKGGIYYGKRSGICLETQFYPDAVNHPEWIQPITPANTPYHSETRYRFD